MRPKSPHAKSPQIVVEISQSRRQHEDVDPGAPSPVGQRPRCSLSGRITVLQDVEPPYCGREQDCGEMGRRKGRGHGQTRQRCADGERGLDALADAENVLDRPKAYRVAQQVTHGPPRRGNLRFSRARRIEPGALQAGDVA